jgi:hypothetical protein
VGRAFDGSTLKLKFDYYDAELEAGFARRELIGTITRTWHQTKLVREIKIWKGGEPMIIPAAAEGKDVRRTTKNLAIVAQSKRRALNRHGAAAFGRLGHDDRKHRLRQNPAEPV